MKKRLLVMLLVSAMLVSLMAGCSSKEEAAEAPAVESTVPVEESAPAEEAVPEEAPAEDAALEGVPEEPAVEVDYTDGLDFTSYPLVDENDDASFLLWTDSIIGLTTFYEDGFASHPVYLQMEDYTGVHIDFKITNEGTSTEQFNLMVVSGDWPDMVHRMNYNGGLDLAVEEEFAIDLTPYIEEYAPNYHYLLNMDGGAAKKDIITDEGNIVAFYCINNAEPLTDQGLIIRQDWLDKLGMEKPKTYEQMHDVLTAFKTEFGAAEPLLLSAETNVNALIGGYGTLGASTAGMMNANGTYYARDGQLKFGLLDEGYKDYLMMIRQWIDEGLVSPTYQTDNDKPLSNIYTINITTGVSGVLNNRCSMMDDYQLAGEDYYNGDFLVEATYNLRMNEDDILHFGSVPTLVNSQGITITSACENVELAMKWNDFWYSKEMTRVQRWGVEGESYYLDENGEPAWTQQMITPPDGYNSMIYNAKYVLQINLIYDIYGDYYKYSDAMKAADEIWSYNVEYDYTIPNAVAMTADEGSEYSTIYADIDTFVSENLSKFMTGDKSFDEWDSFIDQVYDMGIEDCIEIYQAAYDRYAAK
ncbi:MAG: extracellular solute-binding protein [Ruminococcaceae bacterium]|nr:extracellular solute-binding protein [Oscillospiraceae bacterium]